MSGDNRTSTEKLADSSIEHGYVHRYDVPDSISGHWSVGDWHCKCGWWGSLDWHGYAKHLESVIEARSPRVTG